MIESRKNLSPKNSNTRGRGGGTKELLLAHEGHAPSKVARGMSGKAKKGRRQGKVAEEGYAYVLRRALHAPKSKIYSLARVDHALARGGRIVAQLMVTES